MRARELINENYDTSEARIAHVEDLVLHGSKGVSRAIAVLTQALDSSSSISFKPDGKPAVKWGRVNGAFVFGDRYMDPLPTSPKELAGILNSRRGGGREDLVKMYASLWSTFESSIDSSFSGIVFGDLMYTQKPPVKNGSLHFKPNTVEYSVPLDSDVGRVIAASSVGVVAHTFLPEDSRVGKHIDNPSNIPGLKTAGELAVLADSIDIGSIKPPKELKQLSSKLASQGRALDQLLDPTHLTQIKAKALPGLIQKYINDRVRSRSFNNLARDFFSWIEINSTSSMKDKILNLAGENSQGFEALFGLFIDIATAKASIINQLDQMSSGLDASVNGAKGHEGYLVHTKQGPIKLIDRFKFSAANFEK